MAKINLPKEMLEKESFKTLPPKEKEEYVGNLLIKILQLNPNGITTSEITDATGLTSSTIWHHLEILKSVTLSRKVSRGSVDVYYPIGSLNHVSDYDKGDARYAVSTVENSEGKFVCIHEKRENRLGSYVTLRGMAIPFELIDDIIFVLSKTKKSIK
ncbi:MAG: winged helix-turn-helix domain-containing protein [Nanoarchaeota archaeon]